MNAAQVTHTPDTFRIVNLDHEFALPGGVGQPWDNAVVLSKVETSPHPLTGKPQPKRIFPEHGICTLAEAHEFVRAAIAIATGETK